MSPSPEPLSPSSKNNKFYTENAWVVCNQAVTYTESEDRLQTSLSSHSLLKLIYNPHNENEGTKINMHR